MSHTIRNLAIGVAVAAAAGGTYFVSQSGGESTPAIQTASQAVTAANTAANIAAFIPAETRFFMVMSDYPVGLTKNAYQQMGQINQASIESLLKLLNAEGSKAPDGVKFIANFALNLFAHAAENIQADSKITAAYYMVDMLPVLRIKMTPAMSDKLITQAEQASKITATQSQLGDISYRSYTLLPATASKKPTLAIVQRGEYLVISIAMPELEAQLKTALEVNPLSSNLAGNGKLNQLASKYKLQTDAPLIYIDQAGIVKDFLSPNSALFKFLEQLGEAPSTENSLYSAACQKEIGALVDMLPETVMGSTYMNISEKGFTGNISANMDITDQPLLASLSKLRGHIPSYPTMPKLSAGMALNANELIPALNEVLDRIQKSEVTCSPLQDTQMAASGMKMQLGQLAMPLAMANGIKGISGALFDGKFTMNGEMENVDGMIVLTATDPRALAGMAGSLGGISDLTNLPAEDGKAIEISSLPIPFKQPVKLVVQGEYLIAYTGAKAEAAVQSMKGQQPALTLAGIHMDVDVSFLVEQIMKSTVKNGDPLANEQMKLSLDIFSKIDQYDIRMNFGIGEKGVLLHEDINMKLK